MSVSVKGLLSWSLLAVLAGALPGPAAELVPGGPETVMTPSAKGFQYAPSLAALGPAGMVAVWVEDDDTGGAIKARFLDTAGAPVPGEIVLRPGEPTLSYLNYPEVAGSPNGSFAVVWVEENRIVGRHFKDKSVPGTTLRISPVTASKVHRGPSVAMDAAGNFVAVWYEYGILGTNHTLFARRFDASGRSLGEPVQVNQNPIGLPSYSGNAHPRVALTADGGFLVAWDSGGGVRARRFNGPAGTWSSEIELGYGALAVPVLHPDGDGAIVWVDLAGEVRVQRVDAGGAPLGSSQEVGYYSDSTFYDPSSPSVVLDRSGNALVLWTSGKSTAQPYASRHGIQGRLFDRFWQPLGEAFPVTQGDFDESDPAAAASPAGGFVALWTSGYFPPSYLPYGGGVENRQGQDGDGFGVLGRSFTGLCSTDPEDLCLGPGGRFAARVAWRKRSGEEGTGKPMALTKDTGSFWFFGPDNLELMVKMIDGQEVNGYFWVYSGSLSDVEYTLTVRDTLNNTEKSYRNPQGQIASRADVEAFPSLDVFGGDTPISGAGEALFLGDQGRFRVSVEFRHPFQNGAIVQAKAIPLTGDTGAFWFFNSTNIELMIKILDGRPVNGRFWVYYGALSDVRYTITVTDTVTQTTKRYENTPGRLVSRADGEAF